MAFGKVNTWIGNHKELFWIVGAIVGVTITLTSFGIKEILQRRALEQEISELTETIDVLSINITGYHRNFVRTEILKIDQEITRLSGPITSPESRRIELQTRRIFLQSELERLE